MQTVFQPDLLRRSLSDYSHPEGSERLKVDRRKRSIDRIYSVRFDARVPLPSSLLGDTVLC